MMLRACKTIDLIPYENKWHKNTKNIEKATLHEGELFEFEIKGNYIKVFTSRLTCEDPYKNKKKTVSLIGRMLKTDGLDYIDTCKEDTRWNTFMNL